MNLIQKIFRIKSTNHSKKYPLNEWIEGTRKVSTEQYYFILQRRDRSYRLQKNESDYLHSIISELTEQKIENPHDD